MDTDLVAALRAVTPVPDAGLIEKPDDAGIILAPQQRFSVGEQLSGWRPKPLEPNVDRRPHPAADRNRNARGRLALKWTLPSPACHPFRASASPLTLSNTP